MKTLVENANKYLEEERMNPEDWKKNFIVLGKSYVIVVQVIAAEADGWRTEVGFSKGGMVIEDTQQTLKSNWFKSFEASESYAKELCKKYDIQWNPKPYGDRSKIN